MGTRAAGEIVVASFNVHASIDGWGRPFDPLPTLLAADADVLLVVENFWPEEQGEQAGPYPEDLVGRLVAAGYETAAEAAFCRVELAAPPPLHGPAAERWGPGPGREYGLRLLVRPPMAPWRTRSRPARVRGTWGVALLSRLPVRTAKAIPLTPLRRDPVDRVLLHAELERPDEGTVVVTGAHFPHISHGSPWRVGELRRALPDADLPGVLMGDMNCFGPPLALALPGWRRAVRARTWPSWRPIAQPDHIFVSRAVAAADGHVLRGGGSDHDAVVATVRF